MGTVTILSTTGQTGHLHYFPNPLLHSFKGRLHHLCSLLHLFLAFLLQLLVQYLPLKHLYHSCLQFLESKTFDSVLFESPVRWKLHAGFYSYKHTVQTFTTIKRLQNLLYDVIDHHNTFLLQFHYLFFPNLPYMLPSHGSQLGHVG